MGQFIDFKFVIAHADALAVLKRLIKRSAEGPGDIRQSGNELRCRCPLPDHEDKRVSFSLNTRSKLFKCFGCGAQGDLLELVSRVLSVDMRTAATRIAEWSGSPLSDRQKRDQRAVGSGRASVPAEDSPAWQPFTTALRLDPDHAYAERFDHGLIEAFEMGYQDRGLMQGRWCVRLHDAFGQPIGYIGRWIEGELPGETPRWLLPKGFPKADHLFNLHRVLEPNGSCASQHLVIVEGVGDVIRLHGLGIPAVGLFGTSVSDAHLAHLADVEVRQVTLMLDGDEPGQAAVPAAVMRLSGVSFVRHLALPEGEDPASIDEAFLHEHLWWS